ncbi:NUDIX hydrolase [Epibacterium ulvae]|uniref:NUDIX hydrolase n=1 Tax=Epibacterium ulvae TaxID=1156985 RepID=UPI002491AEE2|nr:NUDIX domain-containing protein [Epibacterium ulvae]
MPQHSQIWRPAPQIRVKALGLHWRRGQLLAAEVPNDSGQIKGVRPLGGTIEFGETWQQTLMREFQEELAQEIQIISPPLVLENIFEHEGATGHEIVFCAEISFAKGVFETQDTLTFAEDNGMLCTARWFDLTALDQPGGPALFPTGLKERLYTRTP